jgi:ketosteroid isomerase-like protein
MAAERDTPRTMPEESTTPYLELIRRVNEAFNRRDFDAALATFTPNAVWDFSSIGMGIFVGREAIRGLWEDWFDAFEDWEQVIEELRDLGNGVALAVYLQRGRPAGSSGFVETHYVAVGFVGGDGLTERITFYTDLDEARAAAERLAEERAKAVSEEDVEIVRREFQAFNDRDFATLESTLCEDVVMRLIGGFADLQGAEFRGRDAYLSWCREMISTLDGTAEIETIREVGDHVVTVSAGMGSGATSGIPVTLRFGTVYSFRDGRISAIDNYYDPDEALKAVGLED